MYVRVAGKKIHYLDQGKGKVLVLVHGWGGSLKSLQGIFELAKKNFRVIAFDLPGFGKSEAPSKDWGVAEYALLVKEFIQKLGLKKINYFGHSFGGSLGIYLAAHYPGKIAKLILCAPSFKREKKTLGIAKFFRNLDPRLKKFVYKILFPNSELYKFSHLESNFRKIVSHDLTADSKTIKAETLILWGDRDTEAMAANAGILHHNIKNSKLKIFPGKKHNLPLKYPHLVFAEIQKFL